MSIPSQTAQTLTTSANVAYTDLIIPVTDLGTLVVGQTVYYDNNILGTVIDVDSANVEFTVDAAISIRSGIPSGSVLYVSSSDFTTVTLLLLAGEDETYYLSDAYTPLTYGNVTFNELGSFLNVSDFVEDYKTTEGSISVEISGIPNKKRFVDIIQNQRIKGAPIVVYRAFMTSNSLRQLPEIYARFAGVISNYNIEEDTDVINGKSTNTLILSATSYYSQMGRTIAGQKTNGADRRRRYVGDTTFDYVKDLRGIPEFG